MIDGCDDGGNCFPARFLIGTAVSGIDSVVEGCSVDISRAVGCSVATSRVVGCSVGTSRVVGCSVGTRRVVGCSVGEL